MDAVRQGDNQFLILPFDDFDADDTSVLPQFIPGDVVTYRRKKRDNKEFETAELLVKPSDNKDKDYIEFLYRIVTGNKLKDDRERLKYKDAISRTKSEIKDGKFHYQAVVDYVTSGIFVMDIERIKSDKELGKSIFESVPYVFRPGWGTSLLMTFDKLIKVPDEVKGLYDIVEDENRWKEAHGQFNKIRVFLLNNKRFAPESYLLLAENVAKITYNLSAQSAPFDKDSGWYIPSLAMFTADSFKRKEIRDEILRILFLHYKMDATTR